VSGLFETELGEVIGAVAKSDNEYSAASFPGLPQFSLRQGHPGLMPSL